MGALAWAMSFGDSSTLGVNVSKQARSLLSVFRFMYLHSLHRQESVGAGMNSLSGHSFLSRWSIPDSVATMIAWASVFLQ